MGVAEGEPIGEEARIAAAKLAERVLKSVWPESNPVVAFTNMKSEVHPDGVPLWLIQHEEEGDV